MMDNHVWHIITGHSNLVYAHCLEPDCEKELNRKEIECRLNATERLKATKAQLYSEHIVEEPPFLIDECAADLKAYADILEEKS